MLRIAINEAHEAGGNKLRAVADALVEKAMTGDIAAIKEVADRLDGKPVQAIEGNLAHTADDPLTKLLADIAANGRRVY
jgi:hypothetical protein